MEKSGLLKYSAYQTNLKFRIKSSDENTTLINDNATSDVTNFSGTTLAGIKETSINLEFHAKLSPGRSRIKSFINSSHSRLARVIFCIPLYFIGKDLNWILSWL